MTMQMCKQQLLCLSIISTLNLLDETVRNYILTLQLKQIKLSIRSTKELSLMFLENLRCCIKRDMQITLYSTLTEALEWRISIISTTVHSSSSYSHYL